jgi:hypothetical protein
MNPKILTELERKKVKTYLKADGERDVHVRQLVFLARRSLSQIKQDLELLERLVSAYDSHIKKG